jgi:cytochrome c oxidase assembly protein subunit 15
MYIENNSLNKYVSYWLILVSLILSLMIVIGGLTRLTDSGLSITEWQLFSGIIPPLHTNEWNEYFDLYKKIPEYKLQNFSMTLEEFKVIFWWEFIHRFLGRLIGVFFLIPLIFFTFKLGFRKTMNFHIIFLLICLQGFIGWYMVSSGLVDKIDVNHYRLAMHLALAFIIITLVFWNYLNYKNIRLPKKKINTTLLLLFIIFLFSQIIMGAFVSGMDAGKIYNTWPLMGSSYFPDDSSLVDFFSISMFNEPSLVQFAHRNLAYLIFFFYLIILFKVYRYKISGYLKILNIIGFLLVLQITLGVFTLLSGTEILIASLHQINSIFLLCSSIFLLYLNTRSN